MEDIKIDVAITVALVDELDTLIDGFTRHAFDDVDSVLRFLHNRRNRFAKEIQRAIRDCSCVFSCGHGSSCSDDGVEFHIHGDEEDCPAHGRPGSAR